MNTPNIFLQNMVLAACNNHKKVLMSLFPALFECVKECSTSMRIRDAWGFLSLDKYLKNIYLNSTWYLYVIAFKIHFCYVIRNFEEPHFYQLHIVHWNDFKKWFKMKYCKSKNLNSIIRIPCTNIIVPPIKDLVVSECQISKKSNTKRYI